MSPGNYAQIRGLSCEAEDLSGPVPLNWEQWRSVLEKFGLDDRATMNQRRETVTSSATLGCQLPMGLAQLDFAAIMQITWGPGIGADAKMPWRSCALDSQGPNARDVVQFTGASDEAGDFLSW